MGSVNKFASTLRAEDACLIFSILAPNDKAPTRFSQHAKVVPGASYQFINYVKTAKGEEEAAYDTRGGALTHVPPSSHLVIFYEHLIS